MSSLLLSFFFIVFFMYFLGPTHFLTASESFEFEHIKLSLFPFALANTDDSSFFVCRGTVIKVVSSFRSSFDLFAACFSMCIFVCYIWCINVSSMCLCWCVLFLSVFKNLLVGSWVGFDMAAHLFLLLYGNAFIPHATRLCVRFFFPWMQCERV